MFKNLKSKFWEYITPRLYNKFNKYSKQQTIFNKNKLERKLQSCGFNLNLNGNTHVIRSPEKTILGNNVHIGDNFYAASEGGLIIGDNCHISRNVTIYSLNHDYNGTVLPYDDKTKYKPVSIGENVWIGMNVSILPGVKIDDGAIIGMGTVVNRHVTKNEIVGNDSLKQIKYRNNNHYDKLKKSSNYGGSNGKPLTNSELDSYLPSYYQNRNKKIIFILSTGRSGSNSIVNILNQNPNFKAFHEDIKQLIRISTELAYDYENKNKYYHELEQIFQTKIWQASTNQILIHSDQRLWNLIPFLKDYFPNSKFIHLKRDIYSCVKSMYVRKWYVENEYPQIYKHDWAKYRLHANNILYLNEGFKNEEWRKLNQLEKCTWYYVFLNNFIEKSLKDINKSRKLEVNLENLNNKLDSLSKFLGYDFFEYENIITNKVRIEHRKQYENLNSEEFNIEIDKAVKKVNEIINIK